MDGWQIVRIGKNCIEPWSVGSSARNEVVSYIFSFLQCESIVDGIYNSQWYFGSVKFQKVIPLIMQRGRRPAKLTLYKFSTVSHHSFGVVSDPTYFSSFFSSFWRSNECFIFFIEPFFTYFRYWKTHGNCWLF